jgi:hypothetical protein
MSDCKPLTDGGILWVLGSAPDASADDPLKSVTPVGLCTLESIDP